MSSGAGLANAAIGAASGNPLAAIGGAGGLNLSNETRSSSGSIQVGGLTINSGGQQQGMAWAVAVGIIAAAWMINGKKKKRSA